MAFFMPSIFKLKIFPSGGRIPSGTFPPAPFTNPLMVPSLSTINSRAAISCDSFNTSAVMANAVPPDCITSSARCCATAVFLPSITGIPPAAAMALTNAPPKMPVPPVTTITLSCKEKFAPIINSVFN